MQKVTLLVVCLCGLLRAQDPIGILEGQVKDPASAMVSDAEVTARNAQTGFSLTLRTSREGSFHFPSLPVGNYALVVHARGFALYTASDIRIDLGRVVRI